MRKISPLQRPSRPMREAAQTHYQSGLVSLSRANMTPHSSSLRRHGVCPASRTCSITELDPRKAGRIKEAIDYAVRYQSAQTVEDQERGRRRVEFLKQRYASGATEPTTAPSSPSVSSSPVNRRSQCPKRHERGPRAAKDRVTTSGAPALNRDCLRAVERWCWAVSAAWRGRGPRRSKGNKRI